MLEIDLDLQDRFERGDRRRILDDGEPFSERWLFSMMMMMVMDDDLRACMLYYVRSACWKGEEDSIHFSARCIRIDIWFFSSF